MRTQAGTDTDTLLQNDPRIKLISARIKKEKFKPDALIEILHTAQNAYGYLPLPVMKYITRALHLPPSRVYSTATFYHFFSLKQLFKLQKKLFLHPFLFIRQQRDILLGELPVLSIRLLFQRLQRFRRVIHLPR